LGKEGERRKTCKENEGEREMNLMENVKTDFEIIFLQIMLL
jgi:hypothetical protein